MFLFRLASRLGKTVRWVQRHIEPAELRLWQAFYAIEPWGQEVDYLTKLIAIQMKRGKDWEDFRPYESLLLDNPFEQINIQQARKTVVGQFQGFGQYLLAMKDKYGKIGEGAKRQSRTRRLPQKLTRYTTGVKPDVE